MEDENKKPKGVTFDKCRNRWKARIRIDNVLYHLGSYPTMEDAVKAYQACVNSEAPVAYAKAFKDLPSWGKRKWQAEVIRKEKPISNIVEFNRGGV